MTKLYYCIIPLLFVACFSTDEKVNSIPEADDIGKIEFSFTNSIQYPQNSLRSSMTKAIITNAEEIILSIGDTSGTAIYSKKKLELFAFVDGYVTEPLPLKTGNYYLTEFMIINADNKVIYATPTSGSPLSGQVDNPLPISFTIDKDFTIKIVPEVISTESHQALDFGYGTFSFEIVEENTIDIYGAIFVYNKTTNNYELTSSKITITEKDGAVIFSDTVLAKTNLFLLPDVYDNYTIKIENPGYVTYSKTYTNSELKSFAGKPLVIVLTKSEIMTFNRSFGGTKDEIPNTIKQTSDGGYVIAGISKSNDGDVTDNHGNDDYWIVKLNSSGIIQWQKAYGGSYGDYARDIIQTPDGGYIVIGETSSNDGDVTGNHNEFSPDCWIIKIDQTGTLLWQKNFGGSSSDSPRGIASADDGGYVIAGFTHSNDGDVTDNHGSRDIWTFKINETGNMQWQKAIGGTSEEGALDIKKTTDGGFIIAGYSYSSLKDRDYYIVKIDSAGSVQWEKLYGGRNGDYATCIEQTTDGGYIITGYSASIGGDITGHHGSTSNDHWVVKLDSAGTMQWEKSLGGSNNDWSRSILQTSDGGYVVGGSVGSNDGDVSVNYGGYDLWIAKLSPLGSIEFQKSYGGTKTDEAFSIIQTNDGGYCIAGQSNSNDGNILENHGSFDYWIIKTDLQGNF